MDALNDTSTLVDIGLIFFGILASVYWIAFWAGRGWKAGRGPALTVNVYTDGQGR